MIRSGSLVIPTLVLLLLLAARTDVVYAQGATSTAVPFLLISPDSRASAMGESGVATAHSVAAVFWNPAGLGFQKGKEVSLNHSNWLPQFQQADLFYEFGGYKMDIPAINGTVAGALTYLSLGEFERRDEANNSLGTFTSYELAFTAAYGARLDEDMSVGIGLKLIHSSLSQVGTGRETGSGTATTVAGDLGFMYRPTKFLDNRLSLGTSITNIGPAISYIDEAQSDPLPTVWRLGGAYDFVHEKYNTLTFSIESAKLLVSRTDLEADPIWEAIPNSFSGDFMSTFTIGTGIEYWYSNLVALRFGYFYEDAALGNRSFLTFGAGVRYDIYGFDFSYISTAISDDDGVSPLSETLRFTLLIQWDTFGAQDDGTQVPADDSTN